MRTMIAFLFLTVAALGQTATPTSSPTSTATTVPTATSTPTASYPDTVPDYLWEIERDETWTGTRISLVPVSVPGASPYKVLMDYTLDSGSSLTVCDQNGENCLSSTTSTSPGAGEYYVDWNYGILTFNAAQASTTQYVTFTHFGTAQRAKWQNATRADLRKIADALSTSGLDHDLSILGNLSVSENASFNGWSRWKEAEPTPIPTPGTVVVDGCGMKFYADLDDGCDYGLDFSGYTGTPSTSDWAIYGGDLGGTLDYPVGLDYAAIWRAVAYMPVVDEQGSVGSRTGDVFEELVGLYVQAETQMILPDDIITFGGAGPGSATENSLTLDYDEAVSPISETLAIGNSARGQVAFDAYGTLTISPYATTNSKAIDSPGIDWDENGRPVTGTDDLIWIELAGFEGMLKAPGYDQTISLDQEAEWLSGQLPVLWMGSQVKVATTKIAVETVRSGDGLVRVEWRERTTTAGRYQIPVGNTVNLGIGSTGYVETEWDHFDFDPERYYWPYLQFENGAAVNQDVKLRKFAVGIYLESP